MDHIDFNCTLKHRANTAKECDVWECSLFTPGYIQPFYFEYSKGIGHRKGFKLPCLGRITVSDMEDFRNPKKSIAVPPTKLEALRALALDISVYIDTDEDEYAEMMGGTYSKVREAREQTEQALVFFERARLDWQELSQDED